MTGSRRADVLPGLPGVWRQAAQAKALAGRMNVSAASRARSCGGRHRPAPPGPVLDHLWLVLVTVRAACRQRNELVLENLLRRQLAVLNRPTRQRPRPRLRRRDRLLWVLVRRLRRDGRRHLVVVTPEPVLRWHRASWRLYWRWRSRAGCGRGRPRLSQEVRELIGRTSQENPLWGTERIRGELLTLGIAVSNRSIRR